MLALLSFQFNKDSLRKPEISQLQTKAVAVVGGAVATAILIGVMWRIVWLIRQGPCTIGCQTVGCDFKIKLIECNYSIRGGS